MPAARPAPRPRGCRGRPGSESLDCQWFPDLAAAFKFEATVDAAWAAADPQAGGPPGPQSQLLSPNAVAAAASEEERERARLADLVVETKRRELLSEA